MRSIYFKSFFVFLLIFLLIVLFFILKFFPLIKNDDLNIIDNTHLAWGAGWKNNKSLYSGSEVHFIVTNSNKISFQVNTSSKATQGIKINVGEKAYFLSSPNLGDQQLTIHIDNKKSYPINVRHFCTYFYDPCDITLENILIDREADVSSVEIKKKILSIIGDSISTIYGNDNYSFFLADSLGYQLHNASILGSTLSNHKGFDSAINRYEKALRKINSDVVIVFLGSNDAANNTPINTFERDYLKIIKDIRAWNPESKIFLVGILPREDVGAEYLDNYTEIIRNISNQHNAYFINVNGWLTREDFSDDVHPSIQSQAKIAEKFSKIITQTTE